MVIFLKKFQFFGNFLTFKLQFSGGSASQQCCLLLLTVSTFLFTRRIQHSRWSYYQQFKRVPDLSHLKPISPSLGLRDITGLYIRWIFSLFIIVQIWNQGCQVWFEIGLDWLQMGQIWDFFSPELSHNLGLFFGTKSESLYFINMCVLMYRK